MAFMAPKGVNVRRGRDSDYSTQNIEYKKHWLRFGMGMNWSLGLPSLLYFANVAQMSERDVISNGGEVIGAEYRGMRSNGEYFRAVYKIAETIQYDYASREAAAYFDRIIDSMCMPTPVR
jgi:hypothetical protein